MDSELVFEARANRRRPTAVDLFAGAGGMSCGLEAAGFDVLAAVEYDPVHAGVHSYNFPLTKMLARDVSNLDVDELRSAIAQGAKYHDRTWSDRDEIDLVAGGPPCQGFSMIGKRLLDDPRNRLIDEFRRIVVSLRPRFFIMENVPGMLRGDHASLVHELIRQFESDGYLVAQPIQIVNAADHGVPQDRKRLFLLGAREDQQVLTYPSARTVKVTSKVSCEQSLPILPFGPIVADAFAGLPNLDDFAELLEGDEVHLSDEEVRALDTADAQYAQYLRNPHADPDDFSYPRQWARDVLTSSLRTVHTRVSIDRFCRTSPGEVETISRFPRLLLDGLCNTLRAGTGSERGAYTSPRPIHPVYPRVISVREAARLHSFPDWFRFHTSKWHGFRQVGNAVCPLVGRAVGTAVVNALGISPTRPPDSIQFGDPELLSMSMGRAVRTLGADRAEAPAPRRRLAKAAATVG